MNAILIIDRGSREPEVREELERICSTICKTYSLRYIYTTYCFLEVIPPYIEEGISSCIANGADFIIIIPYFLYPGMKLKDSVKKAASICRKKNVRVAIARPLTNNTKMIEVIKNRVHKAKQENSISLSDLECDVMLIGHGSSDRRAREAFNYMVEMLRPLFRNVSFCFLELDQPNIMEGLRSALANKHKCLLVVPYFLHKGAHIKYDIGREIKRAVKGLSSANMYITEHLGADEQLVDILLERATEVERGIIAKI
jgi:sirohydrochlorin ferrochelatase